MSEEVKIVDTDSNKKHGENRCPKCGASDITYNIEKKKLICNYCYTEFDAETVDNIEKDAKNLSGETRTSGTKDIDKNANDMITLKCGGCGAEVVINSNEATNARCHWCRSILSLNSQVDNGAVPDVVLPFQLTKEEAEKNIDNFVGKRKFYASGQFKKEFKKNNIMGVYFPYMLVDANCHGHFAGRGGHVAGSYTISKGKDKDGNEEKETVYDIDIFNVERDFDIAIDDLTIESSKDKLDKKNKSKTTNVINSIMPFDTENCIKYQANYLAGYTSEKRDINISNIEEKVNEELKDIARHSLNSDLKHYDAGVDWEKEDLDIKGKQWVSAYLPVWLYSYQDKNKKLHYVAVNGRTGETMGSVPMNKLKLAIISILLFLAISSIGIIAKLDSAIFWILTFIGLIVSMIYYSSKSSKYRNEGARHEYESETKKELVIKNRVDDKVRTIVGSSFSTINSANNHRIEGESTEVKEEK